MTKEIAILGGGNGGHAAASDFARRGFQVRMFEDAAFAPKMEKVFQTKQIHYTGVLGEGTAQLKLVTSDIKEAIDGVKVIIIAVPAFAHQHYADLVAEHLQDGQIVLILAGTFGSLLFWNTLKKKGITRDITFAETYTLPYDTRLAGPAESQIFGTHDPIKTGVMPAKRTEETIRVLLDYYPVEAAKSVIDSGLFTLNPVVHVPGCILNAGRIELMQGEFWFYKEGITPCVGKVTEDLDEERMNIIKAMGYEPVSVVDSLNASHSKNTNIYEAITGNEQFGKIKGPDGLKNRYYTEDIPFGLVSWANLARLLGVETPIMDSLITLGSAVMQTDCRATGRQLADMGIADMSADELKTYIFEG